MPYPLNREVKVTANGVAFVVIAASTPDNIAFATNQSGVNALPAAEPGDLTTRTSDTVGTITLDPGHLVVTGRVDLYWSGGKRRGVAGTVTGNSLAITGGLGDNLPALLAPISAVNPKSEVCSVPNTNILKAILAQGEANGPIYQIVFETIAPAEALLVVPGGSFNGYEWVDGSGVTNPAPGTNFATVYMSHSDEFAARNLDVLLLSS